MQNNMSLYTEQSVITHSSPPPPPLSLSLSLRAPQWGTAESASKGPLVIGTATVMCVLV